MHQIGTSAGYALRNRLEITLKSLFDDYGARFDSLNHEQGLRISENARAIAEMNYLISGLSVQLTQLAARKGKEGAAISGSGEPSHKNQELSLEIGSKWRF